MHLASLVYDLTPNTIDLAPFILIFAKNCDFEVSYERHNYPQCLHGHWTSNVVIPYVEKDNTN